MSTDHNSATSLSLDLLSKRPSLPSGAEDSTVSPSSGPCPRRSISWLERGVYPFLEARRLPRDVAYEPLSTSQRPFPRPPVLGRGRPAPLCMRRCVRVGPKTLWDSVERPEC